MVVYESCEYTFATVQMIDEVCDRTRRLVPTLMISDDINV